MAVIYAGRENPLFYYLERSYGITDSIVIDDEGLVTFSRYKGDVEIGVDSSISYEQFKELKKDEIVYQSFLSVSAESTVSKSTPQSSGFIPTIQIPIYIPQSLSFLGGEGAKIDLNGTQSVNLRLERNVNYDPLSYVGARTTGYFNPQLEQQLRLNLQGTIGTKLKILIDHDSERQDETKNKVVVRFEGEEDDVVKLIEVGDTRVSLPSTRFASFPGQSKEGLFGFNSLLQVGPFKVQAIATREKGESQSTSLSRGAIQDSFILYGKDFEKFRFFYIPEAESIVNIQVFVDEQRGIQPGVTIPGFAYYYGYDSFAGSYVPDSSLKEYGNFKVLTSGNDYFYYPNSGILELKSRAGDNYIVAVTYLTSTGRQVGRVIQDTIVFLDSLRLLKPSTYPLFLDTLYTHSDTLKANLWNLMLMNIYDLRATSIAPENIDIQIGRDSSGVVIWGEGGRSFLNLMGIDANNDGRVDLVRAVGGIHVDVLDLSKGILIFPQPRPFAFDSLTVKDSIIYSKTRMSYNEGTTYLIKVVKRQIAREIYLNQLNILPNSEVVRYNGRLLARDKDYRVDYDAGIVTILDENILKDPDAKIDISFDYAPLFSIKDKSLWGTRFELPVGSALKFGGSFMGRSESSSQKRPVLGSEPTMSLVGELDVNFDSRIPILTDLLNKISFGKSTSPSTIRFQGEVARSFPNPNTKNYGYIDDMENSKDEISVSFSIYDWKVSSIPLVSTSIAKDTFFLGRKIVWAGVYDMYKKGQIFSNIPPEEQNLAQLVFYVELYPKEAGIPSFLGISSLLSSLGQDFSNYEYLNVIVKGDKGKMIIDVGPDISENSVWRDKGLRIKSYDPYVISTEDKNGNGTLDEGEDTGLDGYAGADSLWSASSLDDGIDDYYYPRAGSRDYSRVNGTEGNGRLDTEELIVDGKLALDNNYYEITIDLENPPPEIFIGENEEGFKTFLIPLKDTTWSRKFGNPNWGYVRFVRIWFDDVSEPETLVIAQMKFQGNRYVKSPVLTADSTIPVGGDEVIGVRSVGNTDDPLYTSPPGIELERDLITGRLEQENALALKYENIRTSHYAQVTQTKSSTLDFMNYKTVRFFLKPRPGTEAPYPVVYIRLGDSLNYYEYRYKMVDSSWKEIVIDIDSLTQVKNMIRDSVSTVGPHIRGNIAIRGNPSFTQIKSISFGILNDELVPLNGEIWINDLRLGDPRRDRATAYQFSIDFRWANFLSATVLLSRLQSNFKPLQGVASKSDDRTLLYNINADLGSLLPPKWGVRLNFAHMKNFGRSLPLYGSYSDLLLNPDQQLKQISFTESRRTSFSFSKSAGSKNIIVRYALEPLSLSGYVNRDNSSNPRNARNSYTKSLSFGHGIRIPWEIKKGKFRMNPLPEYRFNAGYSDVATIYKDFMSSIVQRDSVKSLDFLHSLTYNPFSFLNVRYDRGSTRDLWESREMGYSEGLSSSLRFSLFSILDPSFNLSTSYRENRDRNLQTADSIFRANLTSGTTAGFNASLNFATALERLGNMFLKERVDSTGKKIEHPFRKKWKTFYSSIQSLRFTYNITDNYGIYRAVERPDWRFRLGIDRNMLSDSGEVQRFSNTFTRQYSVDWGLRILNVSINMGGSFNNAVNTVYISKRYTKNAVWPRITVSNFRISNKFIEKILTNFSVSFSYQQTSQLSGDFGKAPDNSSKTLALSPTLNLLFRNGIGATLSYNKTNQENTDFRFGERTTRNNENRFSLNPTYSIPAGKEIKFPVKDVRVKLKSPLQLGMNAQWSRSTQSSFSGGKETKLRDQTTTSFNFNATYSITRDISGSASFGYRKYRDNLSRRYNSNTNFGVNVNFNF